MNEKNNNSISFSRALELGEDLLNEGKTLKVTAGGSSMFPFIRKGDIIYVKKTNYIDFIIGDVIVFKTKEKFIAHRLLKIKTSEKKKLFYCKGDSLTIFDQPIIAEQIIGKVVKHQRNGRTIDYTLKKTRERNKKIAVFSPFLIPIYWGLWFFSAVYRKIKQTLNK